MHRTVPAAAALAALVLAGAGCGPSLRRTEQSDNSFLRCFDMDYAPGRTPDDKEACWSKWLERRVYNQPADKVAYAELRIAEIGDGISVPGPPGPPGAFHERPTPDPGSPPAPEAEADGGPADTAEAAAGDAGPAPLPGDRCAGACARAFEICTARCAEDATGGCPAACESGYSACMRACFE